MLAKLACTSECRSRFRRGVPLCRQLALSECDLQIKLLLVARGGVGDTGKQVESFIQLGNRFGHRSTSDRTLTRLEPIGDSLLY